MSRIRTHNNRRRARELKQGGLYRMPGPFVEPLRWGDSGAPIFMGWDLASGESVSIELMPVDPKAQQWMEIKKIMDDNLVKVMRPRTASEFLDELAAYR